MGSLSLSDLFSSGDGSWKPVQAAQVLIFRSSPENKKTTIVDRVGPLEQTYALFTVSESTVPGTDIQLSRVMASDGFNLQQLIIGTAKYHNVSGDVDLSLHGQPLAMKQRMLSESYNFVVPSIGRLKWKQEGSTTLELVDGAGMRLARFKVGKRMEVLVPPSEYLLDVMVLSGMAAARQLKVGQVASGVGDFVGAISG